MSKSHKPKVARSVEFSPARLRKYQRAIRRLLLKAQNEIAKEVLDYLVSTGDVERRVGTKDASLTNPALESNNPVLQDLMEIKSRVEYSFRVDRFRAVQDLDAFIARNLPRWANGFNASAKKMADWYARNFAADMALAQRQSLTAAGLKIDFIKNRWSVPVTRGRYIAPQAVEAVSKETEIWINDLTSTLGKNLGSWRETVLESVQSGKSVDDVFSAANVVKNTLITKSDALGLNQVLKLTAAVQRENLKSLGVREAIWKHLPGQFKSRPSHIEMDGKRFNLDEGLYDRAEGLYVRPGELLYCFPASEKIQFTHGIKTVYKRAFSGRLVQIRTRNGRLFSSTPNHPILTPRGIVPIGSLNVGDNLFYFEDKAFQRGAGNENDKILTIGELFNTFEVLFPELKPVIFDCSRGDFHGDFSNGNISVVDVYSFLLNRIKPLQAKEFIYDLLARTKTCKSLLLRKSTFEQCFPLGGFPTLGDVCGVCDSFKLLIGHFSESYIISLATIAMMDFIFLADSSYDISRDPELSGYVKLAKSLRVKFNNFRCEFIPDVIRLKRIINSEFFSSVFNTPPAVTKCGASLRNSDFFTKFDYVNDVRFINHDDYVYNLETVGGWYTCNYNIVLNCRCVARPVLPEYLFEGVEVARKPLKG